MKAPVIKLSLNHPVVLYFVLLVALGNLLYLSVAGKYEFVAIFLMIGFITSFFSKNMTVIMVLALVATSVIQFGSVAGIEGLENKEPEKKEEAEEEAEEKDDKEEEKEKEEKKPAEEKALEKVADKQKDLVDKIEKMEPALKQIESFVERLGKFADYK